MNRPSDLSNLRAILQRRRRDILESAAGAHRELEALKGQERDPEYEEGAQSELADFTLSHLVEAQRLEIASIDAALRRMDSGVYGACVDCDGEIPLDRLKVLPFAVRCEEDARRHEQELRGGAFAMPSL